MRVLKRDMPLSILVDLLLQILFAITIMWLITASVLEEVNGKSGKVSVEELNAKISELESELRILKEENKMLKLEINRIKFENDKIKLENERFLSERTKLEEKLGKDKLQLLLLRSGVPDCFNGEKKNTAAILVNWNSEKEVLVSRGPDFDAVSVALTDAQSILGSYDPAQISSRLSPLLSYQKTNNCKVRIRFYAPNDVPPSKWRNLRSQLISNFRTDTDFR